MFLLSILSEIGKRKIYFDLMTTKTGDIKKRKDRKNMIKENKGNFRILRNKLKSYRIDSKKWQKRQRT